MIGLGRVYDRTGERDEAIRQLRSARMLAAEIGNPWQHTAAGAALAEVTGADRSIQRGPAGTRPASATALPAGLTSRQSDVLRLLATGLSNKQIAAELYLSTATVERHLATIYRNLGLRSRVAAARFALDNGLAETGSDARPG
jgi:DNA-binding NarL/FixJ family response regulator